jgi:hypothetical protein
MPVHSLLTEIAARGSRMVRELRANWKELLTADDTARPICPAVALSLVWSHHAVDNDEFYDAAVRFLQNGNSKRLRAATAHFGRFGREALEHALWSWRVLIENGKHLPRIDNAAAVIDAQQPLLDVAGPFHKADELPGLGPWLFCGPFKILILTDSKWLRHRKRALRFPQDRQDSPAAFSSIRGAAMSDVMIPSQYRVRVKQRLRVLAYAEEHGLKPAARHFALSRTTVRQWRDRHRDQGPEGLLPQYPKRRRRRVSPDLCCRS